VGVKVLVTVKVGVMVGVDVGVSVGVDVGLQLAAINSTAWISDSSVPGKR
jgi:hypothetical protein